MIRGLYASYAGMRAMLFRQDVTASNLANASSIAFKEDLAAVQSFPPREIIRIVGRGDYKSLQELGVVGNGYGGVLLGGVYTDFSQGPLKETGRPTDLALEGEGFFAVSTPQGEVLYTRAGNFRIDSWGRLACPAGSLVLGVDGNPLYVGGSDFEVNPGGNVMVGGREVGKILLVSFEDLRSLEKVGEGLYRARGEPLPSDASIRQGYLESSNVDAVEQMVSMIECFRAYESSQRLLQAQDRTLQRLIEQVAKV